LKDLHAPRFRDKTSLNPMKLLTTMAVLFCSASICVAQSLGDVARQNRLKKPPAAHRVVTDEDAPAANQPNASKPEKGAAKSAEQKADSQQSSDSADEQRPKRKSVDQVRNGILAQRRKIRGVEEESAELQERINQWKGSDCTQVLYPDGSNACDELPQLNTTANRLKSQLVRERTKLDALQEDGRRLGYGNSVYDPE